MKKFTPLAVTVLLLLSSVAGADTKSSVFMYKISSGASYTNISALLGEPASLGVIDKSTKSSCHFRSGSGSSTVDYGASEGVNYEVVPLEETSEGVRTLVSITRNKISNEKNVAVGDATDACSLTTGDFSGHTSRSIQMLPIGKPVAVKMQDGTTYTITAIKRK